MEKVNYTEEEIEGICHNYDSKFGTMSKEDKEILRLKFKKWINAINSDYYDMICNKK